MSSSCEIVKKFFIDKDGVEHRYYDFLINLDGQTIALTPRKDNKRLCNYLLDKLYK